MSFSMKRTHNSSVDQTILTPDNGSPLPKTDPKSPMTLKIEGMKSKHIENMKKAFSLRRQVSREKLNKHLATKKNSLSHARLDSSSK